MSFRAGFLSFFNYFSVRLSILFGLLHLNVDLAALYRVQNIAALLVFIYMICALILILFRKPRMIMSGRRSSILKDAVSTMFCFLCILIAAGILAVLVYMTLVSRESRVYIMPLIEIVRNGSSQGKAIAVIGLFILAGITLFLTGLLINRIKKLLTIAGESVRDYGLLAPAKIYVSGFMLIGAVIILMSVQFSYQLRSFVPVTYLILTLLVIFLKPRKRRGAGIPQLNVPLKHRRRKAAENSYDEDDYSSYGGAGGRTKRVTYDTAGFDQETEDEQDNAGDTMIDDMDHINVSSGIEPADLPRVLLEAGTQNRWRRISVLEGGACEYQSDATGEKRIIANVFTEEDESFWSTNAGNFEIPGRMPENAGSRRNL